VHLPRRTITDGLTGMTMVEVLPGRFTMGSAEAGRNDDETIHDVEITHPFLLGRYEVTQQEWRAIMGTSPSQFRTCGPKCPVENVSFLDVQQFLDKLNAKAGGSKDALQYRLPTEAEWEYACRAGAPTEYSFGDGPSELAQHGWFNENCPRSPQPVGRKRPNAWGFYDMYGNVWEWCNDFYKDDYYRQSPPGDPRGPQTGQTRVLRGGSWNSPAQKCRSAYRNYEDPGYVDTCFGRDARGLVGFRCVKRAPQTQTDR
jgi:formylglycine-generating enzyme required for sulfatase activity